MNVYIKKEDVQNIIFAEDIDSQYPRMDISARVHDLPAADVVEVKHGKWNATDAYPHNVYCTNCHTTFAQTHWKVWEDGSLPRNYCPNCGAKMEVDG